MQPDFWHARWSTAQIGFHRSSVDDNLIQHWRDLTLPKAARVLIPLCGKSLDLLWLRQRGHKVVGVELSDIALQAFFAENGVAARRRALPRFDLYEAENLECFRGDLFELTAERLGPVAAVYDRASLISWTPDQRERYVEHLTTLTGTGGHSGSLSCRIRPSYRRRAEKCFPATVLDAGSGWIRKLDTRCWRTPAPWVSPPR